MQTRRRREQEGRRIPVYYRGVRFHSIRDLGEHLGLTNNQMKSILTDNYEGELLEKEVSSLVERHFRGRACYLAFGKGFETFEEMAEYLKLPTNVLHGIYYKLKEGQSFEEEVQKRYASSSIVYDGEEFPSMADFCRKKYLDYSIVMGRLLSGMPFEEAISKEIQENKGKTVEFRGNIFSSVRSFFNYHGYARTMEAALRTVAPDMSMTEAFEFYLQFMEKNALPAPNEMLTAIPMVYYNGDYYMQRKVFFTQMGVTPRQFMHEQKAKENRGRSDEEIVLRMPIRINGHTGEKMFPSCKIDSNATLFFVKNQLIKEVEKQKKNGH